MNPLRPLILAFAASWVILLCGCGVSSQPPIPLQSAPTASLPSGTTDTLYAANLSASGGIQPYSWSIASGNVPPGLVLSPAGTLYGTPSSAGTFTFTAQVTDSAQPQEVAKVLVTTTIVAQLLVTTASLSNGSPNVFYSAALSATGGTAPYAWSVTQGSLPAGLSLNATTGVVSGTPTDIGSSSFTVQVSDGEYPAATASASLSIALSPPAPRNAVLYLSGGTGLRIQSDGSLVQLPSQKIAPGPLAASPTLPILFTIDQSQTPPALVSLFVNPDYSLTQISTASLPPIPPGIQPYYGWPTVDPTGSNLYVPGYIDAQGTEGVSIYPANGSLQLVSTMAFPNVLGSLASPTRLIAFSPAGAWAYIAPCGSILSYSRSSDGKLTLASTYALPTNTCASNLSVSPDGRYLADVETVYNSPGGVFIQVYGLASDGTIAPVVNQQFAVLPPDGVEDMTWDEASSYLLPMIITAGPSGGAAVLSLSGSTLTETSPPTGGGGLYIQRTGSFVYTSRTCYMGVFHCLSPVGPNGFNFQNGQLQPLPGSPYPYSFDAPMVVY